MMFPIIPALMIQLFLAFLTECNIAIANTDMAFKSVLCCVMCDITFISFSSSVHKCWIAVAGVIVFVYGPFCFYVHSCHIKALVLGWGECRGAFKDIPVTSVCEGRASPGLPPACPLDYCAISPHASAESLRDIRASISHMAALTLPPPPPRRRHHAFLRLAFTLQISLCTLRVCTCVCAPFFFF